MNLVLLCVWEDARVWAPWNHSFDMHPNHLGPVPCFSSSWIPSGCTIGGGCTADGLMASTSFVYWCGRWHFFVHTCNSAFGFLIQSFNSIRALFLHLSILETWLWTSLFLYVQQLFLWKNSISPASSMWFLQVWRSRSSLLSRTHGWSWGPKLGQSVFFYWQWHTYTLVWRHTRAQDSCNWFIQ